MKTSVKNIMMSLALMGCLIFSASDAMAQGRSRSQGGSTNSRSQSAAVSRSNTSSAPAVSRTSSSSSMSRSSDATMQVNRSTSSSSGSSAGTGNSTRGNGSGSSSVNRGDNGNIKTGSSISSSDTRRDNSQMVGTDLSGTASTRIGFGSTSQSTTSGKEKIDNGGKPNGNGGKPNGNGGKPNGNGGKPNGNGGKPNGNGGRPHDNGGRPHDNGGRPGYGGNGNHYDYNNHHYGNDFHRNYTNHSWSWSRPLPPPVRAYRPTLFEWYRPVVPYGWHPYTGAPIIDRILGLQFGTLFDTSIEYLYYNGYEIDGYADHVIYLRNVALIHHLWDDVMLCFDADNRLVNAQFIYHSSYDDRYRYRRVYNSLTKVYGSPITNDSRGISWYGGGCNGWITLSTHTNLGHHYMTLSIGY